VYNNSFYAVFQVSIISNDNKKSKKSYTVSIFTKLKSY